MWLVCVMAVQWLSSRTDVSAVLYDIVVGLLLNDHFKIYISYIYILKVCTFTLKQNQIFTNHYFVSHCFNVLSVMFCKYDKNMFLQCQRCVFFVFSENFNMWLCFKFKSESVQNEPTFSQTVWTSVMASRHAQSECVGLALSLWQRGCWNINRRLFSLIHTSSSILMANATDLRALETDMKLGQDQ